VRTTAVSISSNRELLESVAALVASVLPPPGFVPQRAATRHGRRATRGGRRTAVRPAAKKPPSVSLTTVVLAFEDMGIKYCTCVKVPAAFRKQGAPTEDDTGVDCALHFCLNRLAVAVRPATKQADLELADIAIAYEELSSCPGTLTHHCHFRPMKLPSSANEDFYMRKRRLETLFCVFMT
jgi:hypothetical protein